MKISAIRLGALICVLSGSVLVSRAAQVVLVLRTGADSWQVLEAEKIAINSKSKIRTGSAGSLELQPAEYKKLQPMEILRAGILRRHADGYLVRKEGGNWAPIAPDASVKAATSFAALWSSATIAIQQDRATKGMSALKTDEVFAILPGGSRDEAIVDFVSDPANFHGVGEPADNAAFEERMSLVVSAAGFVTGAAAAKLQDLILSEMVASDKRLSSGIAHYSDLEHGLQYVKVSEKAWPKDERQRKACAALLEKEKWLKHRIAILKAFNAGGLWDAFVDKYMDQYGDFGLWENSFPELRSLHGVALSNSTKEHLGNGKRLYEAKQYRPALIEFKWAQLRSPGDKAVADWIEKVSATDERGHKKQEKLNVKDPDQVRILSHLASAKRYIQNERDKKEKERRWDKAEKALQQAVALNEKSYSVLFVRALLLEAQGKLPEALKVLDEYANVAPDEEVGPGEDLRGTISSELDLQRETLKDAIKKAEADGDYPLAQESAHAGAALDPTDLDFRLHAGLNDAILRNRPAAQQEFETYVRLSQTSAGDEKERATVYNYLEALKTAPAEPNGTPNWYSGYKSPPGLFYCPVSLMPNAQPLEIKASRKAGTAFQWNNGQLNAAITHTQEPGERDVSVYFDYFNGAVRRVATEPFTDKDDPAALRFKADGVKGSGKGEYVALLNHPVVDPLMLERLTRKRVATIVAGNRYFQPFVWKGIYRFLAEYDDQGRVKSATLIGDSQDGPLILDFTWQGLQLQEIAERGGQGYTRRMNYNGNRLDFETISFRGKTSKIKYTYKGERLAEAECGDDNSIDGRSRHVTFR